MSEISLFFYLKKKLKWHFRPKEKSKIPSIPPTVKYAGLPRNEIEIFKILSLYNEKVAQFADTMRSKKVFEWPQVLKINLLVLKWYFSFKCVNFTKNYIFFIYPAEFRGTIFINDSKVKKYGAYEKKI
jgi:hypothetical protein